MKRLWIARLSLSLLATLLLLEVAARLYYHVRHRQPLRLSAQELIYFYYPELRLVPEDDCAECWDVLVLGGSTLHPAFSDTALRLHDALQARTSRRVRIINLAVPSQSSLDSWHKYRQLSRRRFQLVLIYDGFNELRANNVPPSLWREDYGHYAWYDEINFWVRHPRLARSGWMAPFYLRHVLVKIEDELFHRKVPRHDPDPSWVPYGRDIKTAGPLRRHVQQMVDLARTKEEPLVLMTVAAHVPRDYSLAKFRAGTLDYAKPPGRPIELWGDPAHIRAGLAAHNQIIRALAATHQLPIFDVAQEMTRHPADFVDVCHFSPEGSARFAERLLVALERQGLLPPP